MHGAGTTGTRRTTRPSLRSGLRLTPCSPRCTGLFGHRRPRDAKHHREFSISIGMPGPHGLAVRRIASRLRAIRASRRDVHRIPRPTFVTIAKRPSFEHGTRRGDIDFGKNESEMFLREGLDRWNWVEAAREISFCAHATCRRRETSSRALSMKIEIDLPVGSAPRVLAVVPTPFSALACERDPGHPRASNELSRTTRRDLKQGPMTLGRYARGSRPPVLTSSSVEPDPYATVDHRLFSSATGAGMMSR